MKNSPKRNYTLVDQWLMHTDTALRTVMGKPVVTQRGYPAENIEDCELSDSDRRHIAGLMRVNHSGEVSAQALYQGQSITARNEEVRSKLEQAALEENDHLVWTENRLRELNDRTSYLNPVWYAGSFAIGAIAGMIGDKWNLGFLAETEHQVVKHLDSHLEKIPDKDSRSRAILEQMKTDEARHATTALDHGGVKLPTPVKKLMQTMSKIMTRSAYRI
jgi:ubiquinone biosynthesis monooxygenase Coq7